MADVSASVDMTGKLLVRETSLEMRQPPEGPPFPVPSGDVEIRPYPEITVPFYRELYAEVGEPWLWADRRKLFDPQLRAILSDPKVEIYIINVADQPAGFAELDRRAAGEVELVYFGIMPGFIGRKLGPALLSFAIHKAWSDRPERLWVHTCNLDHPAAIGVYERFGFVAYQTVDVVYDDPRVLGLIPEHVAPEHPINR